MTDPVELAGEYVPNPITPPPEKPRRDWREEWAEAWAITEQNLRVSMESSND